MKRLICGALLLLAATLCGCSDHPRTTALLAQAEALLTERPDSALQLLRQLPAERLGSRALKARYALLTAEACARAGSDAETDSLLDAAWDYYRNRPDEIRNRCRTRYYQGRSRLRRGDKPGALRLFLEVEEELLRVDEPYYRGLLCLRIGEVHYAELDFAGAYRRFREARNLFMRSERPRQTVGALLGMTSSALRMRDPERARRDCTLALDLADELQDEALAGRCLACFATLYTVSDRERIPDELLQRIDRSVRGDTTATGLRTLAQVQLLRQRPDSARRTLALAIGRTTRSEERPIELYTAYRIETQAGCYREAARMIHRFIFLNDSLTRATLQTSAGMIEKEYFRERTAFADYRMRSRRIGEAAAAVILLLVVAAGVLLVRQRMRLQRERYERELLLAGEVREKYRELVRQTEQTLHAENRMKGILATRFDIVDRLGKTLYERENTASGQAAMTRQVKRLIDGFAADGEMLPELERIVDIVHDNAMRKLRRDFPGMKQADIRLLCYIFGGFSPQVISLFMHDSVANIYARKSRLKTRIRNSESPERELFIALLEQKSDPCQKSDAE